MYGDSCFRYKKTSKVTQYQEKIKATAGDLISLLSLVIRLPFLTLTDHVNMQMKHHLPG